ncbi:MAG TPA: hypothetical protein VEL75_02810 [Candidatus Methylomirabilis sp.]|nr:hypothetical protein [Candidatus Methylomirabilis sp.]
MDMNLYAMERQVAVKLAEARALSARDRLIASLRASDRGSRSSLVAGALWRAARGFSSLAARGGERPVATPTSR